MRVSWVIAIRLLSLFMKTLLRILERIFHGPSDWLVEHTSARDRRSFGFWNLVAAIVGTFFFGTSVLWVAVLSIVALVPNVTAETPVEAEDKGQTS